MQFSYNVRSPKAFNRYSRKMKCYFTIARWVESVASLFERAKRKKRIFVGSRLHSDGGVRINTLLSGLSSGPEENLISLKKSVPVEISSDQTWILYKTARNGGRTEAEWKMDRLYR